MALETGGRNQMKKLYVTSTKQNDGKTMVTLGLMSALSERVKKVGFIKPIGLKEIMVADYAIDQDASLIERVFSLHANIKDMNPVTIDRDSLDYFSEPAKRDEVLGDVEASFKRISDGCDVVLIKGMVGAACGSVYGLANTLIAERLGGKVLIITSGGIGHPLDDVILNLEHFRSRSLDVIGVVFNKVYPHEIDKLRSFGGPFLEKHGTKLLGAIPHSKILGQPTLRDIVEHVGCRVLAGEQHLQNRVAKILVGAMSPAYAAGHFEDGALLITGGDRLDMVLAALAYGGPSAPKAARFSGLLLTCGIEPPKDILEMLKRAEIPVISSEKDSYNVASRISQMHAKLSPADKAKVNSVNDMIRRHVDVDALFDAM
jgi:BioD-like phosphotransacetylase family protein